MTGSEFHQQVILEAVPPCRVRYKSFYFVTNGEMSWQTATLRAQGGTALLLLPGPLPVKRFSVRLTID